VRHLFSEDIIVTTDMIAIKKLLEQNFKWLLIINKNVKVNYRKFTVMMHEMCMTVINITKQKIMI
jgi:hypothetical protein